jgi:hypothetical protein
VLTANLAIMIFGLAADRWRANGGDPPSRETARDLMRLVNEGAVIFPRPPEVKKKN